mgnify:CR=1 FL=1
MMLDNMSRLHRYQTISISPENLTGEKGKGGMARGGRKGWLIAVFAAVHHQR